MSTIYLACLGDFETNYDLQYRTDIYAFKSHEKACQCILDNIEICVVNDNDYDDEHMDKLLELKREVLLKKLRNGQEITPDNDSIEGPCMIMTLKMCD